MTHAKELRALIESGIFSDQVNSRLEQAASRLDELETYRRQTALVSAALRDIAQQTAPADSLAAAMVIKARAALGSKAL